MNRFSIWSLVTASGVVFAPSCKTSTPDSSGVQDAQTSLIRAVFPVGLLYENVPSQQIEQFVKPADGSNGIPSTMNGVWWTDAHTISWVVSMKHAAWNPVTRTASIFFTGPSTYSTPGHDPAQDPNNGTVQVTNSGMFEGYDIVFSADGKHGDLLSGATDANGNRVDSATGYTMDWVADGDWVRHTPGRPDYHLRRIVKTDGTHDTAFPGYLKMFGPWTQVYVSAPGMTIKEGAPATYGYAAGVKNYLAFAPANPATPSFYHISYNASSTVTFNDNSGVPWPAGPHLFNPSQVSLLDGVILTSNSAGSVQLQITSLPVVYNPAGSVTINGGNFSGTLANLQTADIINLNIPAGVDTSSLSVSASISPFTTAPACCFQIYPLYGDNSQIFMGADGPIGQRLLFNNPTQLAVRYVGDLNNLPPTLSYQLTVTAN